MYEIDIIRMPLKNVFLHGAFKRTTTDSVILIIKYKNIVGVGECAPRMYVTGESCSTVVEQMKKIDVEAIIEKVSNHTSFNDAFLSFLEIKRNSDWRHILNVSCLLELAIMDYLGNKYKLSLQNIIQRLDYANINAVSFNDNIKTTQTYDLSMDINEFVTTRSPFHFIKAKASNNLNQNIQMLAALRNMVGWNIPISIDANMAWSLEQAEEMFMELKKFDLSYVEEPLKARRWNEYSVLKKNVECPILLDESVCSLDDLHIAIENECCDAVNIRISKNGGILNAVNMIKTCKQKNLAFQLGAQVAEVGPLTAAGRHLAFAIDGFFTFEAGQPNRFFEEYIFEPMPEVDIKSNRVIPIADYGLGIKLNPSYKKYVTYSSVIL